MRFNGAALKSARKQRVSILSIHVGRLLQRGRAEISAETRCIASSACRSRTSFNGAALKSARKRPDRIDRSRATPCFNGAALKSARKLFGIFAYVSSNESLQRGRAEISAETTDTVPLPVDFTKLQRGRAEISAETTTSSMSRRKPCLLQRGRAEISAETRWAFTEVHPFSWLQRGRAEISAETRS